MESDSEQVRRAVKEMRKPFDGTCQMCAQNVATELLPARITFLEQRVLTGSEIELSASHVKIGYAPSEETWQSVGIPCFFCQGCAETFRKGWRQSRMKALSMKFIRMIWIVPLAILAIVFIAMLPFVGWTLGAFIVYAIYRNLSRKRAAPYLSSHIRKLDVVAKLLEEVEFVLVHGPFRRL